MGRSWFSVRKVVSAALVLFSVGTGAVPAADIRFSEGRIEVLNLKAGTLRVLAREPERIALRHASSARHGMLIDVDVDALAVHISPRFALRPGAEYVLTLVLPERVVETRLKTARRSAVRPKLIAVAPEPLHVPANTLRIYLTFSEPIARGQMAMMLTLKTRDGQVVEAPFLNLSTELWDPNQKRLTLLLDPGRLKRGVGPNLSAGAPLEAGERYTLFVSEHLKAANAEVLGTRLSIPISVVDAERRAVRPADWSLRPPKQGTRQPLQVSFDRLMDTGSLPGLLRVLDPEGRRTIGHVKTDGRTWLFTPGNPWRAGLHQIVIDSRLEDVAGNSVKAAFDTSVSHPEDPQTTVVRSLPFRTTAVLSD